MCKECSRFGRDLSADGGSVADFLLSVAEEEDVGWFAGKDLHVPGWLSADYYRVNRMKGGNMGISVWLN